MNVVSRSLIGVPSPAGRIKLARGIVPLLVHYTGVNGYNDPTKDVEYAKKTAAYGITANKRWEYNYLIGLGGTVFEQAGEYVGAHCSDFNTKSYGVLFINGIGVEPTEAQILAFHDLRDSLVASGQLSPVHTPVPHYRYRSTGCPGLKIAELVGARWASPTGEGRLGNLHPDILTRPVPPKPDRPVVGVGYRGTLGTVIQLILNDCSGAGLTPDGWFGLKTAAAWNDLVNWLNAEAGAVVYPPDSEVSGADWDLLAMIAGGWERLYFAGFDPAAL